MWEPVLNPVICYTLDSQLMEGNTYLEHSALGVSLDSGPTEGASCLEPLEQSVPCSSLAVRPVEGVTEKVFEWKPVINPVLSYALDSRLMEGNTYRERSAMGVSLDSGPTEGASCLVLSSTLVVRQVEGVTKIVSDWKPVINPVQDITPDGRPMEGTAYPEHLALGASLDSGLRAGMSSSEPLQHLNDHTDVNEDINTDLPDSTVPMMNSQMDNERLCFNPSARTMLDSDIVIHTYVNVDIDADLPENSAPMMNSDLIVLKLDDAIRLEVLRNGTMENMSSHEFNDQLLSSEYVNLNTAEMFLDQVRSVGQRQCNMYMDMEDQIYTVNGVSVYYDGDPYDSEDMEEFDPTVTEGMECRMPTHSHPDGGATRSLDIVDMVYVCITVLWNGPGTHDEELDISGLLKRERTLWYSMIHYVSTLVWISQNRQD